MYLFQVTFAVDCITESAMSPVFTDTHCVNCVLLVSITM